MPALVEEERSRLLTGIRKRVMFCGLCTCCVTLGLDRKMVMEKHTYTTRYQCKILIVDAGIEYLTGTKVESVDIKNKTLKVASGGEDITYDKLIIATGATVSPRILCNCYTHAINGSML